MIDRRFLVITATILHIVAVSSVTDHLVPPPLPPAGAPPQQIQPSSRGGPAVRPQGGFYPNAYAPGPTSEPPGFMQRIARWFGFNDDATRQASQNYLQYKESPRGHHQGGRKAPCGLCNKYPWVPMFPGQIQYPLSKIYQSPQGNEIHQSQWNQHQEHLRQQQYQQQPQPNPPQLTRQQQEQLAGYNYPQHQQQLPAYPPLNGAESQYAPSQFQPPLVQRAVQFSQNPPQDFRPPPPPKHAGNPPPPYKPQPHFAPIPVPQLSPSAVPPVYDAQPFRPLPQQPAKLDPTQFQQLPKLEPTLQFQDQPPSTQFSQQSTQGYEGPPQFQQITDNAHPATIENIGASSEIRNSYPSPQPPNSYQEQQQAQQSQNSYQQQQQSQNSYNEQHQSQNSYQEQQQSQNNYQEQQQTTQTVNSYQEQQQTPQTINSYQQQQQAQQSLNSYQAQQQSQQQSQQSQQSPSTPSFEIIKSHQVTNFVSEIEYPANYVQSQTIDVPQDVRTSTLTPEEDRPVTLTELGSYSEQYTATPPEETHSAQPEEQYAGTDSVVYSNTQESEGYAAPDNYPSASSHNLSVQHENHLDIDPIQHSSSENYVPQSEVYVPTPTPTTVQPQFVTDDSQQTTVEIVPSLQTTYTQRLNYKRDRETPKRLLDSPIHYFLGGSSPRPFTRDPSEMQIRSSTPAPQVQNQRATGPPAPTPWHMAPTPTSTYTSIDASGHYAGMTPPQPKQYHQIIIPYTTKHKPRPFQPKEQAGRYDNWSTSSELDPHEQQESKLVTATQEPAQRTTKYLTKILASNIRELLKKEHEVKNKSKSGFDLSKLQKNIDDWTEQEFTSLSHRASTVSLRGPSKHIPTEYLTTTPSLREGKTTVFTPNHLEPLIFKDRGNKRYEYRQVDDNRIDAQAASSTTPVPSTSTTTTTTTPVPSTTTPIATTTTTTEAPTTSAYYIRAISTTKPPKEDWNQAKVTVSPLTKEKLYVVTPQPVYSPASVGSFKSPRFIVRPTPASAGSNTTPRPSLYTPELFGLMGISAYIPAAPVETFDGHSKVITVVTPSPSIKPSGEAGEAGASSAAASTSETSNNDRRRS